MFYLHSTIYSVYAGEEIWAGMEIIAQRAILRYPVTFPLEEEPQSTKEQGAATQPNQNIPQTATPPGGVSYRTPAPVVPPVYNSPVPPWGPSQAPSGGQTQMPSGGYDNSAVNIPPDTTGNRVPPGDNTGNQGSRGAIGNTVPSDNTGSQGSHDNQGSHDPPRDRVAPVRSSGSHQNIIVAEVIPQIFLLTIITHGLTLGLTS